MMKYLSGFTRSVLSTVVVASALFSVNASAAFIDINLTGAFTASSDTWVRPFDDASGLSSIGPVAYDTFAFIASDSGTYEFSMTADNASSVDPYTFLYQGSFDPSAQFTNFVIGDDDGGAGFPNSFFEATLTAGTTYVYVMSAFNKISTLGGYSATIKGPIAAVPEPQTYAMLLAGLGLLGVSARRRQS